MHTAHCTLITEAIQEDRREAWAEYCAAGGNVGWDSHDVAGLPDDSDETDELHEVATDEGDVHRWTPCEVCGELLLVNLALASAWSPVFCPACARA